MSGPLGQTLWTTIPSTATMEVSNSGVFQDMVFNVEDIRQRGTSTKTTHNLDLWCSLDGEDNVVLTITFGSPVIASGFRVNPVDISGHYPGSHLHNNVVSTTTTLYPNSSLTHIKAYF